MTHIEQITMCVIKQRLYSSNVPMQFMQITISRWCVLVLNITTTDKKSNKSKKWTNVAHLTKKSLRHSMWHMHDQKYL